MLVNNCFSFVCVCVCMSCILLGIVKYRITEEAYGESKPRKFHNNAFTQLYTPSNNC